jgi:hypothetical protein
MFVLMTLAGPVAAQDIPIRSGEHDGYTRLVLDMPGRAEWTLSGGGRKPVLSFEQPWQFDTGDVFDRIARNRLIAVQQPEPGELQLDLGCDCDLNVFWHSEAMLVVDIADAVSGTDLITPRGRPEAVPRNAESRDRDTSAPIAAETVWPRIRQSATLTQNRFIPPAADAQDGTVAALAKSEAQQIQALARNRDQIMTQLGRAASQGLLSPNVEWPEDGQRTTKGGSPPPDAAEEALDTGTPPSKKRSALDNIRAQSSIDRDFLKHGQVNSGASADGQACLPETLVRVADWGNNAAFGAQIGPLNARLYGEFDKPDETVALQLARLYVYFGFGAEALHALRLIEASSERHDVTFAMAKILSDGQASPESPFAGQLDCATSVALWAAMSAPSLPKNTPIDTDAVLRGFSALPLHLRRYIGPPLSKRFLKAGRSDTANRILRILDRGPDLDSPEIGMAKAEAKLAEGEVEAAGKTLDEVVETGAAPSARALVRRIETLWQDGGEISFEMAQLAAAYASETRDTPIHKDLLWAQVVALAASGAFHQAFEEIDRIRSKGDVVPSGLVNDVMGRLATHAEDLDFLQYALPPETGPEADVSTAVANSTAARLLDLGFAAPAQAYLKGEAKAPHHRQRQIQRARFALQVGRPRQAEVELLGLDGPDINLLRAEIRNQLGEHGAAASLFASAGEAEAARLQAWLAEDWARLAAEPEADLSEVASFMAKQSETAGTDTATGQLRRGRNLLGQSEEVREMLRTLLQDRGVEDMDG